MKTKTTAKKSEPKKFNLVLDLAGEKYEAKADTMREALELIHERSFGRIKTWGTFTLKTGGKKAEIKMRPLPIKRHLVGNFGLMLLEKKLLINLK